MIVRLKNRPRRELLPTFTSNGQDTFLPQREVFLEQDNRNPNKWHIKKKWADFFKNLTELDYFTVEYQEQGESFSITDFKNMGQRLPTDSRKFLNSLSASETKNFGLLSQKSAIFKNEKFTIMDEEAGRLYHEFTNTPVTKELLDDIQKRQSEHLDILTTHGGFDNSGNISLTLPQRMVVGLGTESVHETSMTLHPVYGIPYIPASAIKGVLRNYVINELFRNDKDEASEEEALQDPVFCQWFGCPKDSCFGKALKGRVTFLDSFPVGNVNVVPDVMTPHFQKYYMDEKNNIPPADWLEPNPLPFVTVEDMRFTFAFVVKTEVPEAWTDKDGKPLKINEELKEKALTELTNTWLPKALEEHGIGAKTAVGYGLFDE